MFGYTVLYNISSSIYVITLITELHASSSCPPLREIENGEKIYVNNTNWPTKICRVYFRCDPGYQMVNGSANIYCFYGKWTGPVPQCIGECSCLHYNISVYLWEDISKRKTFGFYLGFILHRKQIQICSNKVTDIQVQVLWYKVHLHHCYTTSAVLKKKH